MEFLQHRMSVRKRRKAAKPIAVRQTNWSAIMHYLLSVYNSHEQSFSLREFWGIFELKKVCITQKKNFTSVF